MGKRRKIRNRGKIDFNSYLSEKAILLANDVKACTFEIVPWRSHLGKGSASHSVVVMARRVFGVDHLRPHFAEPERILLRPKFRPYLTAHEVRGNVALLRR